ncbi:MAG: Asp-tRNA(Asn)/Glu-tRNA(Gln) amidotransferase subunit GatB [Candidatus Aenigmarchaeota archaeon]|nr:Asp-tRNA(Asn)/Glu-tRNA(Gln) amidotransferase subunit GatB [Candidatus Aenigmarchaeota archaeon]
MEGIRIGLEVHVQLDTRSKLFCSCANENAEPNTNVCDVCLGFPGTKPRLNEKAIEQGIKIALALGCNLNRRFLFSRKTYFYPDLSKDYQITQQEVKLARGGSVKINNKEIRLRGIHLEEDPARIVRKDDCCLLDYNRSGTPLVEIVTEPDLSSPAEARLFLQKLQQIIEYLYVTDFRKEGCMRMDANISVTRFENVFDPFLGRMVEQKKDGERVEIKNISGIKDVEKSLSFEIIRQKNVQEVKRETRLWNEKTKTTTSARAKEEEEDYGYIFEPDLPIMEIDDELLNKVQSNLPELPDLKKKRYLKMGTISEEIIDTILTEPEMANYFEYLCETHSEKPAATILAKYVKKTLNYHNISLKDSGIEIRHLRRLLDLLQDYKIMDDVAELVIREMVYDAVKKQKVREPDHVLRDLKLDKPLEEEQLEKYVRDVIRGNAKAVRDYENGHEEAFNYLVGQVMKKSGRHASPGRIREMIKDMI